MSKPSAVCCFAALCLAVAGPSCDGPMTHEGFENISQTDSLSMYPCVACDASGNVVVAWTDYCGGGENIWYVEKSPGGDWSEKRNLSQSGTGDGSRNVSLKFDSAGGLHAAWSQWTGSHWDILYRQRLNGQWSVPETTRYGLAVKPLIGVDESGEVHLVFEDYSGTGAKVVYTRRSVGGHWTPCRTVIAYPMHIAQDKGCYVRPDGACLVAAKIDDSTSYLDRLVWTLGTQDVWTPQQRLYEQNIGAGSFGLAGSGTSAALMHIATGRRRLWLWHYNDSLGWCGPDSSCKGTYPSAEVTLDWCPSGPLAAAWQDPSNGLLKIAWRLDKWSRIAVIADSDSTYPFWASLATGPGSVAHLVWCSGRDYGSEVFYTEVQMDR